MTHGEVIAELRLLRNRASRKASAVRAAAHEKHGGGWDYRAYGSLRSRRERYDAAVRQVQALESATSVLEERA